MINKKDNKFQYILEQYQYNLQSGDIVAGTIYYKEFNGFLVMIGNDISGYLPQEEINPEFFPNNNKSTLLLNATREFFIIKYNTNIKQYILSIKRISYIRGWNRIKQLQAENIILITYTQHINKGGLIIYLEKIQAFIPKSHIALNNKSIFYNKRIECKILIANEKKNQLILSNKSACLHLSPHKLKTGEITYGIIIKIKNYGIFLNIYNTIALLHISEIGSMYINNINNMFTMGELIKVKIIHIDKKQGRISVSKRNIKIA